MMGMAPSEVRGLAWWEYQALLYTWNERHTPEGEKQAEAPEADFVARRMQRLADRGLVGTMH